MPRLINRFTWSHYIKVANFRELLALMVEGRGIILVTGHYGSFELVGHLLASFGFRTAAVMRPLDNYYLNGTVVRPESAANAPLLVFSQSDLQGEPVELAVDVMHSGSSIPGLMDNSIASFWLKRGYMAVLSANEDGTGPSKTYIAIDDDLKCDHCQQTDE